MNLWSYSTSIRNQKRQCNLEIQPPRYGDKRYVCHINYNREKLMELIRILKEKHPNIKIKTK